MATKTPRYRGSCTDGLILIVMITLAFVSVARTSLAPTFVQRPAIKAISKQTKDKNVQVKLPLQNTSGRLINS